MSFTPYFCGEVVAGNSLPKIFSFASGTASGHASGLPVGAFFGFLAQTHPLPPEEEKIRTHAARERNARCRRD